MTGNCNECITRTSILFCNSFGPHYIIENTDEPPKPDAQQRYDMLNGVDNDNELWPCYKKNSQLACGSPNDVEGINFTSCE